MRKILVAPSILSADFSRMGEECKALETCGADMIHCDVMDGVFVPNITFGIKMVKDIAKETNLPLDVHLMIVNPKKYVKQFVDAGADIVTIHYEACSDVEGTLKLIRDSGAKAGISIKPNTPSTVLDKFIDFVDLILIMSVEPGFGGQKFMPSALLKLEYCKELICDRDIILEVDGGVNIQNSAQILHTGCNCLVAGNTVFKAEDKAAVIIELRKQ